MNVQFNSKISSFTQLKAWQESHKIVLMTYGLTKKFPKDELFGIISQMRRSAISISSNIAEGFSRNTKGEKQQFYGIAKGSLTELQNQFIVSRDLKYITTKEFDDIAKQTVLVSKLIYGLIYSSMNRS
jgi:four helix bundle protein